MIRIDCRNISGDPAQSEQLRLAHDCLVKNGYAILDHVFPADKIRALNLEFNDHYARFREDREYDDTLEVGTGRFLVPIDLAGGFGDPFIYANPLVVALVRETLEPDAILEAYGAVVSLPGSKDQDVHRDSPLLFSNQLSPLLPAHALNFGLPLIEMNEWHGTTALHPRSHRWGELDKQAVPELAVVPVGSCIIWDFRLYHYGTPNRSDRPRPLLYSTFARRWYQDPVNFSKATQRRLTFDPAFFQNLSDDRRQLFSHIDPSLAPD
ncbi:MAG: phytanoyl-CoA dioxygenase family protein [Reyranella sp.]|nr:phytanoyl-CoA dioxygenase family protein [Reyranella sp.]